jgi:hypothetical protein
METASPPVSPSVVAAILMIQKSRVAAGTLLVTPDAGRRTPGVWRWTPSSSTGPHHRKLK